MVKDYYKKISELGIGKLLLILLAGILLALSYSKEPSIADKKEEDKESQKTEIQNYSLESAIEDALCRMSGVSEAKVVVTYLDSGRKILVSAKSVEKESLNEQDTNGGIRTEIQSSEEEEYIYIGDEPYVVMEVKPTVCGVLVLYKGNMECTKEIMEAVKVLTGVDYNRIKVSFMN